MSPAALQAMTLKRCVEKYGFSSARLPGTFDKARAKVVAAPWQIAAGATSAIAKRGSARPPARRLSTR